MLLGGLRGLRDLRELGMEGMGGIEGNFETFGKVGKSFNALRAPHTAQRATHALKFSRAEGWEKREICGFGGRTGHALSLQFSRMEGKDESFGKSGKAWKLWKFAVLWIFKWLIMSVVFIF